MLGGRQYYEQAPFFWSQHYELRINYVGHAEKWDRAKVVGDINNRGGLVKLHNKDRVVAVASIFRDEESLHAELDLEGSA